MIIQIVQLGKRNAIYIPKKVVRKIGINEGDKLILEVKGDTILLKPVKRGLTIPKPWTKVTYKDVERVGVELSERVFSREISS